MVVGLKDERRMHFQSFKASSGQAISLCAVNASINSLTNWARVTQ